MEKRYQVFVSSTYADLREERQEVIQALLELDCIPAGMELFPAADDDQWTLIRKVIDDCDYYIVIVAGRYGSLGPGGKSYTQMEYEYALETGKPVIGFLHEDPGKISAENTEKTESGKAALSEFRELVKRKLCKYWTSKEALGSVVSRSIIKLIKAKPGIGWVRADMVPSEAAAQEILKLRKKIEDLETQLEQSRLSPPTGADELAQGHDLRSLTFFVQESRSWAYFSVVVKMSWNNIFAVLGPSMLDEAGESTLKASLWTHFQRHWGEAIAEEMDGPIMEGRMFDGDFRTIIVQLRALGLIQVSIKRRSARDHETYWSLTRYGDQIVTQLRAIRSDAKPAKQSPDEYEFSRLTQRPW